MALVSDAGLPAISDPGSDLVQLALEAGITVIPIPGPNAALSALIVSGLPTERFTFGGFLPREKKDMRKVLEAFDESNGTLLFYESPHRIRKTLVHLEEILGDRSIVLARELTKRHEEFARGTVRECIDWLEEHPPLGEYCLLVEGIKEEERKAEREAWWQLMSLADHVSHYEGEGHNRKDAMKKTATDRGLAKRDVYNALIE